MSARPKDDDEYNPKRRRRSKKSESKLPIPSYLVFVIPKLTWERFSDIRRQSFYSMFKAPNAFFYRNRAPGEEQVYGHFSPRERSLFFERLNYFRRDLDVKDGYWGYFSVTIKGRVGYQCANFYRKLIHDGTIVDGNYHQVDGKLRYHGARRDKKISERSTMILRCEAVNYLKRKIQDRFGRDRIVIYPKEVLEQFADVEEFERAERHKDSPWSRPPGQPASTRIHLSLAKVRAISSESELSDIVPEPEAEFTPSWKSSEVEEEEILSSVDYSPPPMPEPEHEHESESMSELEPDPEPEPVPVPEKVKTPTPPEPIVLFDEESSDDDDDSLIFPSQPEVKPVSLIRKIRDTKFDDDSDDELESEPDDPCADFDSMDFINYVNGAREYLIKVADKHRLIKQKEMMEAQVNEEPFVFFNDSDPEPLVTSRTPSPLLMLEPSPPIAPPPFSLIPIPEPIEVPLKGTTRIRLKLSRPAFPTANILPPAPQPQQQQQEQQQEHEHEQDNEELDEQQIIFPQEEPPLDIIGPAPEPRLEIIESPEEPFLDLSDDSDEPQQNFADEPEELQLSIIEPSNEQQLNIIEPTSEQQPIFVDDEDDEDEPIDIIFPQTPPEVEIPNYSTSLQIIYPSHPPPQMSLPSPELVDDDEDFDLMHLDIIYPKSPAPAPETRYRSPSPEPKIDIIYPPGMVFQSSEPPNLPSTEKHDSAPEKLKLPQPKKKSLYQEIRKECKKTDRPVAKKHGLGYRGDYDLSGDLKIQDPLNFPEYNPFIGCKDPVYGRPMTRPMIDKKTGYLCDYWSWAEFFKNEVIIPEVFGYGARTFEDLIEVNSSNFRDLMPMITNFRFSDCE